MGAADDRWSVDVTEPTLPMPDEQQVRESIRTVIVRLDQAMEHVDRAIAQINWQYKNKAWLVLGYESWEDMCAGEYQSFAVAAKERPEWVQRLRFAGMTQAAIAKILGVDQKTISNDLTQRVPKEAQPKQIEDKRGRVRSATRKAPAKKPKVEQIVEAEVVYEAEVVDNLVRVTVDLDKELVAWVDKRAEQQGTSRDDMMTAMLSWAREAAARPKPVESPEPVESPKKTGGWQHGDSCPKCYGLTNTGKGMIRCTMKGCGWSAKLP